MVKIHVVKTLTNDTYCVYIATLRKRSFASKVRDLAIEGVKEVAHRKGLLHPSEKIQIIDV